MSLDAPAQATPHITSLDELTAWIRAGERPANTHLCGVETEKLGAVTATGAPAPLTGERSIAAVLRSLAEELKGGLLEENGVPMGVQLDGASIALEPGGQLELSGRAVKGLGATAREISHHLALVRQASDEVGLTWLAVGYRPFGPREAVPWLPRGRYALMRRNLPGSRAHDMMQMTASVQANFDFVDEADLASKVSTATAVSPFIAALFANSPLLAGKPSGLKTQRYAVWRDVDPARCGLLRFMFEPGFTPRKYVEWALKAPLLFIRRGGEYRDAGKITFEQLLRDGFAGEPATMQDFVDLLSTLFPEIRVKRVIEVRGADAVDEATTMALPALWTGLLYDRQAREDARKLVDVDFEELLELQSAIPRDALQATTKNLEALGIARDLVQLADDGLRRRCERGEAGDERVLLDPLREIAKTARTGADRILDVYARTGGDPAKLVEAMRY